MRNFDIGINYRFCDSANTFNCHGMLCGVIFSDQNCTLTPSYMILIYGHDLGLELQDLIEMSIRITMLVIGPLFCVHLVSSLSF